MDQQRADIAVAAFADPAENLAIAARTLSRYEPEPSREVAPGPKALGIVHREHERGRGHDADTGDRHQAPAGIRFFGPRLEGMLRLRNPHLGLADLVEQQ